MTAHGSTAGSAGAASLSAAVAPQPLRAMVAAIGSRVLEAARRRAAALDSPKLQHLDAIVDAFRDGFDHACRSRNVAELISRLSSINLYHQGFAYEGAAMALGLLDAISPWRRASVPLFVSLAAHQVYVVHVGFGWALARVGSVEGRAFKKLDWRLRWLAIDGVGFHDGYMNGWKGTTALPRRARLSSYGARAFDQGLGRALWFTTIADPHRIALAISLADEPRRPDLWSGVGLACAYAGGVTPDEILALRAASGTWRPHLAQGVAFGAEAHARATGTVPPHTELAARIVCGASAEAVARTAREAALNIAPEPGRPAYETWRVRVRSSLREEIL